MSKFKIGDLVICNGGIYKVKDYSELGCHGWQYLLDDGNWYYEAELSIKE